MAPRSVRYWLKYSNCLFTTSSEKSGARSSPVMWLMPWTKYLSAASISISQI